MKILFVTDLCPIERKEKLPNTLLNFIKDFTALGHEVLLLRPNVILNVLIRKRKIIPEGVYEYSGIKSINKNFLTPFFSVNQFKFLKDKNFDIILSHMPSGILAANKISKLLNIPYFASVHSSDITVLEDIKYFFVKSEMKKAYLEAKKVLPRSFWLKEKIEKIIPELKDNTFVIPSGIDSKLILGFDEINSKADKFYGMPLKIFAAGSLIKRKNFQSLITAVKDIDDIELKIAGSGPYEKKLRTLIKKYNLKNKVKLLGQKSNEEIYSLMDEANVFILPSYKETFGMVYLEALARGCIVVCTKNSGMSGFIKHGYNGFLTDSTPKGIKDTINEIKQIKSPETIIKNALCTSSDMTSTKMAKNYLNIIQNILF